MAIQLVVERKCLATPSTDPSSGKCWQNHQFESVLVEQHDPTMNIVPDIVGTKTDGSKIFIEIYATHRVDQVKKIKLMESGISTVEVDLSELHKKSKNGEYTESQLQWGLEQLLFVQPVKTTWLSIPGLVRQNLVEYPKKEVSSESSLSPYASTIREGCGYLPLSIVNGYRESDVFDPASICPTYRCQTSVSRNMSLNQTTSMIVFALIRFCFLVIFDLRDLINTSRCQHFIGSIF